MPRRDAAARVQVDGREVQVDAADVRDWRGLPPDAPLDADDAQAYVAAHPHQAAQRAIAQRIALLRRLAAGPATRAELRRALREVGWVGSADLDNRLRELSGRGGRTPPGLRLGLRFEGDEVRLDEPFPDLEEESRRALAFARALLVDTPDPMAQRAVAVLDGMLPGLARRPTDPVPAPSPARVRLDVARERTEAVAVRYRSVNRNQVRDLHVVPLGYATAGATVKALCAPIHEDGSRARQDVQLALERVLEVRPLPAVEPDPEACALQRERIVLDVDAVLYQIMQERDLFDVAEASATEVDLDVVRVTGWFPVALAWDVMEQLCAWAGVAQAHEPLWLVRAVVERLRAGLEVVETAAPFRVVKPSVGAEHGSLEEALHGDPDAVADGPRKLAPPGTVARPDRDGEQA